MSRSLPCIDGFAEYDGGGKLSLAEK